jgi:geranylgeranyl diphosphate synthase type I
MELVRPDARRSAFPEQVAIISRVKTSVTLPELTASTEQEILRLVSDRDVPTAGLYAMCRYHLGLDGSGSSGKRLRPLLGLLSYASIAGDYRAALPGAAAVELGHNFSLVHDDIEDGDTERRHRPTLWAVQGIPQAINAGDMLFALSRKALHRLTDLGFSDAKVLRMMRLHDDTCLALCEGQYIDIWASERSEPMSVELYFDMIGRKTAALIAASVEAGAVLATDDENVISRYRAFGWALGVAFQLNDDLLGIWGEEALTGKEPTDVARHKMTLPVIYAFEHAGPTERGGLEAVWRIDKPDEDQVAEAVTLIEKLGGRDYTRDQARAYRDQALAELEAAGVVDAQALQSLRAIIMGAIKA